MAARTAILPLTILLLSGCASSQTARLTVDATDLPRHLLHAELTIPAGEFRRDERGAADVWFVEGVQGNHNPSGPVQNLVNFTASDDKGRTLRWSRDPRERSADDRHPRRRARGALRYLHREPAVVNSRSSDSYGRPNLGVINFNTVLFYPGGATRTRLMPRVRC